MSQDANDFFDVSHAAFRLVAFHQLLPPIVFSASKYALARACADTDGAVAPASVSLSGRDPSMTPTVIAFNVTIRIHVNTPSVWSREKLASQAIISIL